MEDVSYKQGLLCTEEFKTGKGDLEEKQVGGVERGFTLQGQGLDILHNRIPPPD